MYVAGPPPRSRCLRRNLPHSNLLAGSRRRDWPSRRTRQTSMDPTIKDFEAALTELDAIVRKLEDGDIPLEQSLQLFERGVQLSRFCHARLEEAERRIEILNERGQLEDASSLLNESADHQPSKSKS